MRGFRTMRAVSLLKSVTLAKIIVFILTRATLRVKTKERKVRCPMRKYSFNWLGWVRGLSS